MHEVILKTPSGSSRIIVGEDFPSLRELCGPGAILAVVDSAVLRLHPALLSGIEFVEIGSGDEVKSLASVEKLYHEFFDRKLDRSTTIVGIGGGAVLDAVGFAAATYLRGLRFAAVATTLLAQVDASVGGKNGVNFAGVKNLIGTTRQPFACVCSTALLRSLPASQISQGFAEVIKHGVIADQEYFSFLEENVAPARQLVSPLIEEIIRWSVEIKVKIVEADETETGDRKKLNFGHTSGHAIEAVGGQSHGDAISIGMVLEARIAQRRGTIGVDVIDRMQQLLSRFGLPISCSLDPDKLMQAVSQDKKRQGSAIVLPILSRIGACRLEAVGLAEIEQVLA